LPGSVWTSTLRFGSFCFRSARMFLTVVTCLTSSHIRMVRLAEVVPVDGAAAATAGLVGAAAAAWVGAAAAAWVGAAAAWVGAAAGTGAVVGFGTAVGGTAVGAAGA